MTRPITMMTAPAATIASAPSASPSVPPIEPLRPADFEPADIVGPHRISTEIADNTGITVLTASDRVTLLTAQGLLRAARKDANGKDPKLAKQGRARILMVVSYLSGFFDSRALLNAVPLNAGYESLIGKGAPPSLDLALDNLDASLTAALVAADTRGRERVIANAVGDAFISVGASMVAADILKVFL